MKIDYQNTVKAQQYNSSNQIIKKQYFQNIGDTVSFEGKTKKKNNKKETNQTTDKQGNMHLERKEFEEKISSGKYMALDAGTFEIIEDEEKIIEAYNKSYVYLIPKVKPDSADEKYWKNFSTKMQEEVLAREFLDAYSTREMQKLFMIAKGHFSIDELLNMSSISKVHLPKISKWLENANINNPMQLFGLLKTYSHPSVKPCYGDSCVEFIEGYGLLEDKSNMIKYPLLILDQLVQREDDTQRTVVHENIDSYVSFLNHLGVNSIPDFMQTFSHLSENYNNFDTMADVADAIDEVAGNYTDELDLLEDILKQHPSRFKKTSELYLKGSDVIDFIFNRNNRKNLDGLEKVLDYIGNKDLSQKGLEAMAPYFNDYLSTSDKVEFYEFLASCQIDPKDFSKLTRPSIVTEESIKDSFINYAPLVKAISKINGTESIESRKTYTAFKDIINAVYKKDLKDTGYLEILLKVIKANRIGDAIGFLKLYNSAYQTNKRELTSEEIKDFLDLMKFAPDGSLSNIKCPSKEPPIKTLQKEKEQYEEIKDNIESFLDESQSSYFALDSAIDIYNKYKSELLDKEKPISQTLQEITSLEASDAEEYKYKKNEFRRFEKYFKDADEITAFLRRNEITLEEKDEEYRSSVLKILELLDDDNSREVYNYVLESSFIKNSRSTLSEFLNSSFNKKNLVEFLKFCYENKIDSIGYLENFLEKNNARVSDCSNLMAHFRRMPKDMTFEEIYEKLKELQIDIQEKNFSFKISNANILDLSVDDFLIGKCTPQVINALMGNKEQTNPVSTLPDAFTKFNERHTNYKIAQEILKKLNSSRESYMGISRLLGIQKDNAMLEQYDEKEQVKMIQARIPEKFFDFVNSSDWLYKKNGRMANLSLHAKLRLIDRYALKGLSGINELYSKKTQKELIKIQKIIYEEFPESIKMSPKKSRYNIITNHDGKQINTIYTHEGKMVTIAPPRN